MLMGTRKWLILLTLILTLTVSPVLAEERGLLPYAMDNLTEVYGYLSDEVKDFVFEPQADGSLAFWPKAHPGWVYTAFFNAFGQVDGATPFHTGYTGYCGENAVRDLLRNIRDNRWIASWSEENKAALLDACLEENVRISTDLYLSESAAQALQAFFESCYGPTAGWTDALFELRDSVFAEYGLTAEEWPFHVPGVRRISRRNIYQSDLTRTYTLFEGEYPDELKAAFSDPHLSGWACFGGALSFDESREKPGEGSGFGLAAFEKDGKRQLVQLVFQDAQWTAYPLGANALYPTGDYRVTFDTQQNAFAVQYRLSDDETATFYLTPTHTKKVNADLFYITIENYERVNRKTGEAIWIGLGNGGMPTWQKELTPDDLPYPVANFTICLGVIPITEFPTTLEAARAYTLPGVPEGYVFSAGVNLRTQKSSRSHSYGMLNAGTLLPLLEELPGDPNPWVRTKVGFLEGFVTETYVYTGQPRHAQLNALPAVEAQKEIPLKKGTGLFDGTVQTLPAGTKMHVIIENDDWLYVDVPQGEIEFLMDVDGAFGYVRKADVTFLSIIPGLDWAE